MEKTFVQLIKEDIEIIKHSIGGVFFRCSVNEREIHLMSIVVDEDKRRHGIGTRVISNLQAIAEHYNLVMTLNPSSQFGVRRSVLKRFYESFGFVENKGSTYREDIDSVMYYDPKNKKSPAPTLNRPSDLHALIGKRVSWLSQSPGSTKLKEGKIVGIVEKGESVVRLILSLGIEHPNVRMRCDNVSEFKSRIVVKVDRVSKRGKPLKPWLYTPSIGLLEVVS